MVNHTAIMPESTHLNDSHQSTIINDIKSNSSITLTNKDDLDEQPTCALLSQEESGKEVRLKSDKNSI